MTKGCKFTDIERHAIIQCVKEALVDRLNDKQTLALIKIRTGVDLPYSTMTAYKREAKASEINIWLDEYAQTGYIEDFRDSSQELKTLRDTLWKAYEFEISKPADQQKYYKIAKLSEMILKINIEIRMMTFQTPAMRIMKYYIDKGKEYDRQPLRYNELPSSDENRSESSGSGPRERPEQEDENRVA